jgi:Trypsin/PEP-CTERM motif
MFKAFVAVALAGVAFTGVHAAKVASGTTNGISWSAQSTIIGQTPTSVDLNPGVAGGGDPLYFPTAARQAGTVALIMDYGGGNRFICSGTLMSDRRSILTAGHCVSDGFGTANPLTTTAYFWNGGPNERVPFNVGATAVNVSNYFVNSGYTGQVIDQNDIAVLRLADLAPAFAQSFELTTENDLTGDVFTVAGYGGRSTIGGAFGADARTGFLREGDNRYDFRLGDADFNGFWDGFFGTADVTHSYVADFDNGLAINDTSCRTANGTGNGPLLSDKYCNTGLGAREANIAGGDSGGPGFINGKVASVNSYGLSFGTGFGDFRTGLNSSWGEFGGYVPVHIHRQFILGSLVQAVPEPATWAMMIAGFGMIGGTMRVRRRQTAVA